MKIIDILKKHGVFGAAKKIIARILRITKFGYYRWAWRNAPKYKSPDDTELFKIEEDFNKAGIKVHDYKPLLKNFLDFQGENYFPPDYHGGIHGPVWDEKLLEHWVAIEFLGLKRYKAADIYVDIAAGGSPWAKVLRNRFGISAYAIDLSEVGEAYRDLSYYRMEDATATTFFDSSVSGASLQCSFEMFMGNHDMNLIKEMARILKPGGKVVIVPLYMQEKYSAYSTVEYYGKGNSDPAAKEYVCQDWTGIPSARFYDVEQLKKRVLKSIENFGMKYKLFALRNQAELGKGIYCHFILEVTK
jgi:ubiquinone/menaquinone biosynthesis C-methylase UbiE